VPDPWSLAHVRARLRRQDSEAAWILAYPGHGRRSAERQELETLPRAMEVHADAPRFTLMTRERLGQLDLEEPERTLRVALSGGGRAEDVEAVLAAT